MKGKEISRHELVTKDDYPYSRKVRNITFGWIILFAVYIVTRLQNVQTSMFEFARDFRVNWIEEGVEFIIFGFKYIFLVWMIKTVFTLLKKQKFDTIVIYDNGLEFILEGVEHFELYENIRLSYGEYGTSFYIQSEPAGIGLKKYFWSEFDESEQFRYNIEKYGEWQR